LRARYDTYIIFYMRKAVTRRKRLLVPPSPALDAPHRYRIGDFPMHYIAAIQRQNQINLGHALRPIEMSVPTWRVLSALNDSDGLTIGQLAERCVLDRSSLGRLLEDLAAEGLVQRETAPDDRRTLLIRRTPQGEKRFHAALTIVREHYRRLLRGISSREFDVLIGLLRRIKANARMMSDVALMEDDT
jgi:DNA-binding MarR family transcriptional regulator